MPYTSALYVLICQPYMHAKPHTRPMDLEQAAAMQAGLCDVNALYVCLICLPYMSLLGLWIWNKPLRCKQANGEEVQLLVIDTVLLPFFPACLGFRVFLPFLPACLGFRAILPFPPTSLGFRVTLPSPPTCFLFLSPLPV